MFPKLFDDMLYILPNIDIYQHDLKAENLPFIGTINFFLRVKQNIKDGKA